MINSKIIDDILEVGCHMQAMISEQNGQGISVEVKGLCDACRGVVLDGSK